MSLELALHTPPEVPMEAECISPQRLGPLSRPEVERLPMIHGNRSVRLGDFFNVRETGSDSLRVTGDLERMKYLGAGMGTGELVIEGNVGAHLGAGMSGGSITVTGNAADWVGPEMSGGRIVIHGNAGHMVGSAYRGSARGMTGGEIFVHGNVRNEAGHAMRNGVIAIGGNCGDFCGVNMLAGTIIVMGECGIRNGAGMKRGTLVFMNRVTMLPTFSHACAYHPPFLGMYLRHIQSAGLPVDPAHEAGLYDRWCGDSVELNRGEILVFRK